jgi:hypothetical protein
MLPLRYALLGLAAWLTLGGSPASAQNWYETIIPEKAHDFGTVARGSRLRHTFRIVNTTSHDVHIAGERTKCGCTDVKIGARDIPPGTQTTVEVTLDTTKFTGFKPSGLTLVFDRPEFREVDLNLSCFIRGDVMLNPGGFDFGVVPRGSARSLVANLTYHGGRPDWAITKVTTISEDISAQVKPVGRSPGGAVQYLITATLSPTAPAGYLRDEITLATNDPESPTIPVSVTANVQAAVTVAPGVLNLGRLRPGSLVKKTVLVKASQPFKVTSATSPKPDLTATGALGESKPFHTLTVTLVAPTQPGPYHAVLEIATDLKDEPPAKVSAFATIVP